MPHDHSLDDLDSVPWPATLLWGAVVFLLTLVVLWLR